jgi:hypothetical protein
MFRTFLLVTVFLFSSLRGSNAQDDIPQRPITFAGVWLSGRHADIEKDFPVGQDFTLKPMTAPGEGVDLSQRIYQTIEEAKKKPKKGGKGGRLIDAVVTGDSENTPSAKSGNALVMACVINRETVDHLRIGGGSTKAVNKSFAQVEFTLVIADFKQRSIFVALPGKAEFVSAGEYSDQDSLRRAYADRLVMRFMEKMEATPSNIVGLDSIGVTSVVVRDEVKQMSSMKSPGRIEEYFGNIFGASAYDAVAMPVSPFSRGSGMVFCAMQDKLADASDLSIKAAKESGEGVSFTLKKPVYQVELNVVAYRNNTVSSQPGVGRVIQNCAYSRVTVKHGEEVIYTSQEDGNVMNRVPAGSEENKTWAAYLDATEKMFKSAAQKIKAAAIGKSASQKEPLLVKRPDEISEMFSACAPWVNLKIK